MKNDSRRVLAERCRRHKSRFVPLIREFNHSHVRALIGALICCFFFTLLSVDAEYDDIEDLHESSLPESDIMSPDSNHNLQLTCNETAAAAITAKLSHIRNGSIEDDQQQAMMEAIEAMESIKVMNGMRHSDDSFDCESQDGQQSSQKYYMADTPSSDLVIDERSLESHSIERSESPDTESCLKLDDSDKGW